MNKHNLLSAAFGVLIGFILGYVLHEVMVARQPLRRLPGEGAVVTPGPGGGAPDDAGLAEAPTAAAGGSEAATGPGGSAEGNAGGGAGTGGAGAAAGGGGPAMAEIQQLRDYVASHPRDADAVLKLANLNFDISNWGRARDLYTQYVGLREPNPDVLTDLGTCYRQLRDFNHALEQFRRAEQLAPSHWKSRFAEVVVLAFDLNQRDAAEQAFAKLQEVAPAQPEVARLGDELRRRRGAGAGG
jgi:Tetratricopeptide repeat